MMPVDTQSNTGRIPIGPVITYGFAIALALWCAWFITHLPALAIPESASIPILLGIWALGAVIAGMGSPKGRGHFIGAASGLVTALIGLLILGSKMVEQQEGSPAAGAVLPGAPLRALGFLVLGLVIGAVGGFLGNLRGATVPVAADRWLARYSIVAAIAVIPLLLIGGHVTSTGSGMAVPDWPGTYGSSMFLYPLGPRADPGIYREHAHRLFGTFVGLSTLTLMIWVLLADTRRWLKITVAIAVALVVFQGLLGAARVLENNTFLAFIHGIFGQVVFGLIVGIAVALSPTWRTLRLSAQDIADTPATFPRARFWATGTLHATLMQLILGAAFRHFGGNHALWTHAAFAFLVVLFAVAAGFMLRSLQGDYGGIGRILRRTGLALLIIVGLQFLLGWGAFAHLGIKNPQAGSAAIIRTLHQANGALLLAAAVLAFSWTKRLNRLLRESAAPRAPEIA
jgi:heme a synthase